VQIAVANEIRNVVSAEANLLLLGLRFGVSHVGRASKVFSAAAACEKNTRSILNKESKKFRGFGVLFDGIGESTGPPSTAINVEPLFEFE
jgi:hypothetical protein